MPERVIVLKASFKRHFMLLIHLFLVNSLIYIVGYWILGNQMYSIIIVVLLVTLIIDILPTIMVHLQYIICNYHKQIFIDLNQNKIILFSAKSRNEWSIDDILTLDCYSSYAGGSSFNSFSYHKYCKVTFRSGENLIITNLMLGDIKAKLPSILNIKPENHYRVVAFIY